MPTSRPSRRCSRPSRRSTRSGTWATSWATGRSRTRSSPACASIGALGVRGNHDAAALGGRDIESFNVDARRAMEWTRATIADETRAWLAALPERLEREDFLLVHGSPRDPTWEYVTTTPVARAGMAAMPTPNGLHGHTHVPIAFVEDDGRLETMSPGVGLADDLRRAGGSCSTPAASASRGTGSRRPRGSCSTPATGRRPGSGPPTTSRPSRRRCCPSGSPTASSSGCRMGCSEEPTVIADVPYRRSEHPHV